MIKAAIQNAGIIAKKVPYEKPFRRPEEAERSRTYIEVRGFAWFTCPQNPSHRWSSNYSNCFIDLKRQYICYRDVQFCRYCHCAANPRFTEDSMVEMVRYVVQKYAKMMHLKLAGNLPALNDHGPRRKGHHIEESCGRCIRRGRSCVKYH